MCFSSFGTEWRRRDDSANVCALLRVSWSRRDETMSKGAPTRIAAGCSMIELKVAQFLSLHGRVSTDRKPASKAIGFSGSAGNIYSQQQQMQQQTTTMANATTTTTDGGNSILLPDTNAVRIYCCGSPASSSFLCWNAVHADGRDFFRHSHT